MKNFTQSQLHLMRWLMAGKRINMAEMLAYKHMTAYTEAEREATKKCIADLDGILEVIESRIKK